MTQDGMKQVRKRRLKLLVLSYLAEEGVASTIPAANTVLHSEIVVRKGSATVVLIPLVSQHVRQRRLKLLVPFYRAEAGVASAILAANTVLPCEIVVRKGSASVVLILLV